MTTSAGVIARIDAYERLVRLDKPIGIALLLWPTLSALWLAAQGAPSASLIVIFTLGTILMRSAGCAINDWADRRFDAHVERTAQRPLATGEIHPWEALVVGAALRVPRLPPRARHQPDDVALSVPALGIAIAYPFFKRFFVLPQAFLGIAFSFGIPMAYAAVLGTVPAIAWWLLVLNLFWVVAYDTEYAMVDRDDDVRLGLRHVGDRVRPLRRPRGHDLLRGLSRRNAGGRSAAAHGAALFRRALAWRSGARYFTGT